MLDVRRLQVLVEVARGGSITAAAKTLNYTPSAVSQQMLSLERATGSVLLERGARGVQLTEPGHVLLTYADEVLARLDTAEAHLRALSDSSLGHLRLGWFATAGTTLMPRAIATFKERHPGVRLSLVEVDPDECVARLRARELELGLLYQFEIEPDTAEDLEQTPLLDDRLSIALPAQHRLARRRRLRLTDLAGERWIQGVARGSTTEILPRACQLAGFVPDVALRTDDHMAVQGLVAAGVGVALIPGIVVPTARTDIVVRPLVAAGLLRQVRAALPQGSYRPPASQAMLGVLKEVCDVVRSEAAARLREDARR